MKFKVVVLVVLVLMPCLSIFSMQLKETEFDKEIQSHLNRIEHYEELINKIDATLPQYAKNSQEYFVLIEHKDKLFTLIEREEIYMDVLNLEDDIATIVHDMHETENFSDLNKLKAQERVLRADLDKKREKLLDLSHEIGQESLN